MGSVGVQNHEGEGVLRLLWAQLLSNWLRGLKQMSRQQIGQQTKAFWGHLGLVFPKGCRRPGQMPSKGSLLSEHPSRGLSLLQGTLIRLWSLRAFSLMAALFKEGVLFF